MLQSAKNPVFSKVFTVQNCLMAKTQILFFIIFTGWPTAIAIFIASALFGNKKSVVYSTASLFLGDAIQKVNSFLMSKSHICCAGGLQTRIQRLRGTTNLLGATAVWAVLYRLAMSEQAIKSLL